MSLSAAIGVAGIFTVSAWVKDTYRPIVVSGTWYFLAVGGIYILFLLCCDVGDKLADTTTPMEVPRRADEAERAEEDAAGSNPPDESAPQVKRADKGRLLLAALFGAMTAVLSTKLMKKDRLHE